ncbi:hypothetical protein KBC31_04050 [Candidatus Saccharibacteria bacterium]|nr:hypothetical protein [Candidatus Saccharibacteria bacterium]
MDISNTVRVLGFTGALIGGYAYLPQITHMIEERCSAGISPKAFRLWTLSSSLVLTNALYLGAPVFIFLCVIQLSASFTILIFSIRNKNHVCQSHMEKLT